MDTRLLGSLEQVISKPRLQRYRDTATTDLEAATLYCWNIQLAEALFPPLAIFEVTLRNTVHDALSIYAGTDYWFKSVLHERMYSNITDLIARITRRQGQPPTAGKVISEITFGFWPLLFAKSYNSLWWNQVDPLLTEVIPNFPKVARDTRSVFQERLEYIVILRNRVMHHEAIFQGVAALNRPVLQIDTLYVHLLETLNWINADAAMLASCVDHFDDAFHNGRSRVELELLNRFQDGS